MVCFGLVEILLLLILLLLICGRCVLFGKRLEKKKWRKEIEDEEFDMGKFADKL